MARSHAFRQQTRVVFQQNMKCFYDTVEKIRLRGLVRLLKENFWPKYSFKKAVATEPRPASRGCSARGGRARGVRVDREVQRVIDGHKLRAAHPFTRFVFSALEQLRVTAVASQVVVYDLERRLATAVDILGRMPNGTLCVIELKCSSDHKYESACGRMKTPFAKVPNSLKEQHTVQCMVTRALFERTYKVKADAFILRVHNTGATLTRVPRAPGANAALKLLAIV